VALTGASLACSGVAGAGASRPAVASAHRARGLADPCRPSCSQVGVVFEECHQDMDLTQKRLWELAREARSGAVQVVNQVLTCLRSRAHLFVGAPAQLTLLACLLPPLQHRRSSDGLASASDGGSDTRRASTSSSAGGHDKPGGALAPPGGVLMPGRSLQSERRMIGTMTQSQLPVACAGVHAADSAAAGLLHASGGGCPTASLPCALPDSFPAAPQSCHPRSCRS